VLLHRLAPDASGFNNGTTDVSYSVDPIPRLDPKPFYAVLMVLDLAGCMALAWAFRWEGALPSGGRVVENALWLASPAALWLIASHTAALYSRADFVSLRSQILPALATCCLAFAPWAIAAAAKGSGASVASVVYGVICQSGLMALSRVASRFARQTLLGRGYCLERVIVLADTLSAARALSAELEQRTRGRLRVAACASIPWLHSDDSRLWLESTVRSNGIGRILAASKDSDCGMAAETIVALTQAGAEISFVSAPGEPVRLSARPDDLPRLTKPAPPLDAAQAFCKRCFDIVVAGSALVVLAPLLLVLAAIVRLDSRGPAIFRQRRHGLHGKPFQMFKFRTMYHHMADQACLRQTARNDARVTRFGRLLRSTSFDELPQLLNVLRGDMSMVGPRPHALGMTVAGQPVGAALQGYEARHRMKPGITGWAQVNGSRGEVAGLRALRRRVALDCHYIENWSLRLDAWIVVRTVALIFLDKHAF